MHKRGELVVQTGKWNIKFCYNRVVRGVSSNIQIVFWRYNGNSIHNTTVATYSDCAS